jgi:hypothetical protein
MGPTSPDITARLLMEVKRITGLRKETPILIQAKKGLALTAVNMAAQTLITLTIEALRAELYT